MFQKRQRQRQRGPPAGARDRRGRKATRTTWCAAEPFSLFPPCGVSFVRDHCGRLKWFGSIAQSGPWGAMETNRKEETPEVISPGGSGLQCNQPGPRQWQQTVVCVSTAVQQAVQRRACRGEDQRQRASQPEEGESGTSKSATLVSCSHDLENSNDGASPSALSSLSAPFA